MFNSLPTTKPFPQAIGTTFNVFLYSCHLGSSINMPVVTHLHIFQESIPQIHKLYFTSMQSVLQISFMDHVYYNLIRVQTYSDYDTGCSTYCPNK